MTYNKTTWVNGGPPGVSAELLNKIEQGIKDAHDEIATIEAKRDITYQFSGNIGPGVGQEGEWDFVLPAGVTEIHSARLIVRGKKATDITSGTNAPSGDTGFTGAHTHPVTVELNTTFEAEGHSHSYGMTTGTQSAGGHSHYVNPHSHLLTKGLSQSTTPTSVNVYLDNGSGFGGSLASASDPVLIDSDIAAVILPDTALKRLRVTTTRLGMVDVVLLITAS